MITLPITVLLYEGPIGRAYLARMKQYSFQPAVILLMVLGKHPGTKKTYPKWMPWRAWYAEKVQTIALNHWPRYLRTSQEPLFKMMLQAMEPVYENVSGILDVMHGRMNWRDYSPEVEKVMVDGFKDPKLKEALLQLEYKTILYTGGGIIPKSYFELEGLRYIHVHPGHLPHVRGSDGVLYSITTRGKPGVSMFYMEAGLDTGDIIAASDQTLPDFRLSSIPRPDDQTLYRALYSYYDPILRAAFFVQTVKGLGTKDLSALPVTKQDANEGATYRFMKDEARREALGLLFRD